MGTLSLGLVLTSLLLIGKGAADTPFKCLLSAGNFPDPIRCEKFYNCYNWVSYEESCPEGTLFDETRKDCIDDFKASCGTRIRPSGGKTCADVRDSSKPGITWTAYCASGRGAECDIKGGNPTCTCTNKDHVVNDGNYCRPKTCHDDKDSNRPGISWSQFCLGGRGTECDATSIPPRCACTNPNHILKDDNFCSPKACDDVKDPKYPGISWSQFCLSGMNTVCDPARSSPQCVCKFADFVMRSENTCSQKTCKDEIEPGKSWFNFCSAGTWSKCDDAAGKPTCRCISTDHVMENVNECRLKTCTDDKDSSRPGISWSAYCSAGRDAKCDTKTFPPRCVCANIHQLLIDGNQCRPKRCDDVKDPSHSGMSWSAFCSAGVNAVCDPTGSPPRCICKSSDLVLRDENTCTQRGCDDEKSMGISWTAFCLSGSNARCDRTGGLPRCICSNPDLFLEEENVCRQKTCSDVKDPTQPWITWAQFCGLGTGALCEYSSGKPKCVCSNTVHILENENKCRRKTCYDVKDPAQPGRTWTEFCRMGTGAQCDHTSDAPKCVCDNPTHILNSENQCRRKTCYDFKDSTRTETWGDFCKAGTGAVCDPTGAEPKCVCSDPTQTLNSENQCKSKTCADLKDPRETGYTWADFCKAGIGARCDSTSYGPKCVCSNPAHILEHSNRCRTKTCADVKDPTLSGRTWAEFCSAGRGAHCDLTSDEPKCVCDNHAHVLINHNECGHKTCADVKDPTHSGRTWAEFCSAGTGAHCGLTSGEPNCECANPAHVLKHGNECGPKNCDDDKEPGISWSTFCSWGKDTRCVLIEGRPDCECRSTNHIFDGFKECRPKTCDDAKDISRPGISWKAFCLSGLGAICDSTTSPPKCTCENKVHVVESDNVCRPTGIDDWVCPKPEGIFIHPNDIKLYIMCQSNYPHVMHCPGQLIFDPNKLVCIWVGK